ILILILIIIILTSLSSILLLINFLISKKIYLNKEKISPFECGFNPRSNSRLPFRIQFLPILERVSHAHPPDFSGIHHPPYHQPRATKAKSPKACTPGGIQPPSCLRPSVLRGVP
ncbi:NU3M oxidoreductase, partial [Pseudoatta argentina]